MKVHSMNHALLRIYSGPNLIELGAALRPMHRWIGIGRLEISQSICPRDTWQWERSSDSLLQICTPGDEPSSLFYHLIMISFESKYYSLFWWSGLFLKSMINGIIFVGIYLRALVIHNFLIKNCARKRNQNVHKVKYIFMVYIFLSKIKHDKTQTQPQIPLFKY